LKEGEEEFIKKAKIIKRFGAAVVVMAVSQLVAYKVLYKTNPFYLIV
jgi:cobalamin-dependent methionine synthase I